MRSGQHVPRRLRVLILHRTPAREKDRIVEAFSREEGKVRLLAAGVRRFPSRRAGHLEPLLESELVVSSSSRGDSIRNARVLHAFPALRQNFERLACAYEIVRLLRDASVERLPDPELYDAVIALFHALDAAEIPLSPLIVPAATLHVLRSLGYVPDLTTCARCRRRLRAHEFSYDTRQSVFVCRACGPSIDVPPALTDAVKLLRLLHARPVPPSQLQVSEDILQELRFVLEDLVRKVHFPAASIPRLQSRSIM